MDTKPKHSHNPYHRESSQNKRREEILQLQKSRSKRLIDIGRGLLLEHEENIDRGKNEHKQKENWKEENIMLYEPLQELPHDFLKGAWFIIPIKFNPIRCIVTSHKAITIVRNEEGIIIDKFPSLLPNGSRRAPGGRGPNSFSILDCIFDTDRQTFYVLDMVCWKGQYYTDCPTSFRFYWIKDKLSDVGGIDMVSSSNYFKFEPFAYSIVDKATVNTIVSNVMCNILYLLIHSESFYQTGYNALACSTSPEILSALFEKSCGEDCIGAGDYSFQ